MKPSAAWRERHSLSEVLAEAEEQFSGLKEVGIVDVYKTLFKKHFGKAPQLTLNARNAKVFKRVLEFCVVEEVDPRLYITAQMDGMKKWLVDSRRNRRRIKFQPSMLSPGQNSAIRFNVYVRRAFAQYGRVIEDDIDALTPGGQFRRVVTQDETRVGSYYCAARVVGEQLTWAAAVEAEEPGIEWRAAYADPDEEKCSPEVFRRIMLWRKRKGPAFLRDVRRLARLRAAAAVAETYSHGLADLIGIHGEFQWSFFAALLRRLYARPKPTRVKLDPKLGRRWGRTDA